MLGHVLHLEITVSMIFRFNVNLCQNQVADLALDEM